jgi:hypothetical protein
MAPSALDTIAGNLAGGAIVGDCHHGVLPVVPVPGSPDVDNGPNTFVVRCLGSASGLFVEGRL